MTNADNIVEDLAETQDAKKRTHQFLKEYQKRLFDRSHYGGAAIKITVD